MKKVRFSLKNIKKRFWLMVLIAIFLFFAITNLVWVHIDNRFFVSDEDGFLQDSLYYFENITHPTQNIFMSFIKIDSFNPPLIGIAASFFYAIFGKSFDVAVASNILFLGILIFSVYGIGKTLFDRKTGLLAAFITMTFPCLFGLSRVFTLDYGLTALVSAAVYLLLLTDGFKSTKFSLLFGVTAGFGLLTKQPFIIFIIPPVLFVAVMTAYRRRGIITKGIRVMKKLLFHTFFIILAGSVTGTFLWSVACVKLLHPPSLWIGNMIITPPVLFLIIIFCTTFLHFLAWFSIGMIVRVRTKDKLEIVLKKDAYTHLTAMIFCVFFIRFFVNIPFFETALIIIFVVAFFAAKLYVHKLHFLQLFRPLVPRRIYNLFFCILIMLLISGWWYASFLWGGQLLGRLAVSQHPYTYTGGALSYYTEAFANQYLVLYLPIALPLLVFIVFSVIVKKRNWSGVVFSNKTLLLVWFLCPFLVFSIFVIHWPIGRFLAPILPAIGIAFAGGLSKINRSKIKTIAVIATILVGTTQYIVLSYAHDTPLHNLVFEPDFVVDFAPNDYKTDEILNHILSDLENSGLPNGRKIKVLASTDVPESYWDYSVKCKNLQHYFAITSAPLKEQLSNISRFDYLILQKNAQQAEISDEFIAAIGLIHLKTYEVSEKITILLYRCY